ncbi:MAG TPA: hypothetical protein VGO62_15310, partial [Myxococcota bacterium]
LELDNDSLLAGTGLTLGNNTAVCARDNAWSSLSIANNSTIATCAGGARKNALLGSCSGTQGCRALCTSAAPADALCDTTATAAFEADGSCPLATSALVDAGDDLGLDLVDDDDATFIGAAPDIGGRERGSSRRYGSTLLSCP